MPKLVQIRDVPDGVHRQLKSRAALEGRSLSEYLRRELEAVAAAPTRAELVELLRSRTAVESGESSAASVRAERDRIG